MLRRPTLPLAAVAALCWALPGTVQGQATLVKDINPGGVPRVSLFPTELAPFQGGALFNGSLEQTGRELWRTDGTAAGTFLLRDINATESSFFGNNSDPEHFTIVGASAFFVGATTDHGVELWKTDGTPRGTVLVKDVNPGPGWGLDSSSYGTALIELNGILLFGATDGVTGFTLWRSDGTAAGTVMVKDIHPGGTSDPRSFTKMGGILYFVAYDDASGAELWRSDGTAAGTFRVRDIALGAAGSAPDQLTAAGSLLFFTADDGVSGRELWRSDGTAAGTALVRDLTPGPDGDDVYEMAAAGGILFFGATEPVAPGLWKSDGTAAGTVLVSSAPDYPTGLVDLNGSLVFAAQHPVAGRELWKSDGTAPGTLVMKDVDPGSASSDPEQLTVVNGVLYFAAWTRATGKELWKSNGTGAGTLQIADLVPGPLWPDQLYLMGGDSLLYFSAELGQEGVQLWRSDGTPAGTLRLTTAQAPDASSPEELTALGSGALFTADDGAGRKLWRTDGTNGGTTLVAGPAEDLTGSQGSLFFRAESAAHGSELWTSDGQAAGTRMVGDIRPGAEGSAPEELTAAGGSVFFSADDGMTGRELWHSDGSPGSVRRVDIFPGQRSSRPELLTRVGGSVFFAADDGVRGRELWRSDGTPAGTGLVKDIEPGLFSTNMWSLTGSGSGLFFFDGFSSSRLWRSDGTDAGTIVVKEGLEDVYPQGGVVAGGLLFFAAGDEASSGRELWKSDGTTAGTVLVEDLAPGPASSDPQGLTAVNGILFFAADDGVHGRELWRSDGTAAGTFMVKDLVPGLLGSYPAELSAVGRQLYFSAADDAAGTELWRSDGTEAGTTLAAEVAAGALPSFPGEMRVVAGRLLFAANDDLAGRELWALPLPDTLWVSDAQVLEGQAGTATAVFTISLTTPNTAVVSVDYTTAGGTASAGSDYSPASGTLTFSPGVLTRSVSVLVSGDLVDEPDESFLLRLSGAVGADLVDAEGEAVILDDDGPSVSAGDLTVAEGSSGTTSAVVTVTLSAPSVQGVSVDFATANGSAAAPADYAATSGRVDIAPGTTAATLTVPVVADTMDEFDETFAVNLSSPQNATLADTQALVTITDDDAPPTLSLGDVVLLEGNQGTLVASFAASLSAPSGKTVGAQFTTRDGSASAGTDYVAVTGGITFDPGATSRPVAVTVNGDTTAEPDEAFFVDLSAPVDADLADAEGLATLLDDDAPRGFHTVTPCRLVDTRQPADGPALGANTSRTFPAAGRCNVPAGARSVVVNVVAVNPGAAGNLRLHPAGSVTPNASVLNFRAGRTRAGNAVVTVGANGGVTVRCDMPGGPGATSHLVLDVYGYFE